MSALVECCTGVSLTHPLHPGAPPTGDKSLSLADAGVSGLMLPSVYMHNSDHLLTTSVMSNYIIVSFNFHTAFGIKSTIPFYG